MIQANTYFGNYWKLLTVTVTVTYFVVVLCVGIGHGHNWVRVGDPSSCLLSSGTCKVVETVRVEAVSDVV